MSIEQAKAYIERMKSDKVFADQVMAIKDPGEIKAFIKNAGFDFTVEEMKALKAELSGDDWKSAALCSGSGMLYTQCKNTFC